jgi:prepilin-type N-terminal cleavage/methylation domain-containing protein
VSGSAATNGRGRLARRKGLRCTARGLLSACLPCIAHRPRGAASGGFTLIELVAVVAIIGLMLSAATIAFRNVTRAKLRSAASRTAATMRFAFDRATMTGDTYRLALDLDRGEFWLESSVGRVTIREGREQHHTTDEKEAGPQADPAGGSRPMPLMPFGGIGGGAEGEAGEGAGLFGVDADALKQQYEQDLAPVARPKSLFEPVKKKRYKTEGRIRIDAVVTARMVEPVTEGIAHVYFFPQGHAEPAVIHLVDCLDADCSGREEEEYYSVVLHPLTGRAKVYSCQYEIPEEFGSGDDRSRRRRQGKRCGEAER